MKLVITMQVVDDDNNVVAEKAGNIAKYDEMSRFQVIHMVKQWVSEKLCALTIDSIFNSEEPNQ